MTSACACAWVCNAGFPTGKGTYGVLGYGTASLSDRDWSAGILPAGLGQVGSPQAAYPRGS